MAFMSNHGNSYYYGMPFGLKNAGTTYQWLMEIVFVHEIGMKLAVYVNNMIVKK